MWAGLQLVAAGSTSTEEIGEEEEREDGRGLGNGGEKGSLESSKVRTYVYAKIGLYSIGSVQTVKTVGPHGTSLEPEEWNGIEFYSTITTTVALLHHSETSPAHLCAVSPVLVKKPCPLTNSLVSGRSWVFSCCLALLPLQIWW